MNNYDTLILTQFTLISHGFSAYPGSLTKLVIGGSASSGANGGLESTTYSWLGGTIEVRARSPRAS